jgi:pilus assembly protein Flp/PilA
MAKLKRFFKVEEGVTAIEYALIAMLIAVAIIGAVAVIGTSLQKPFNDLGSALP